MWGASIYAKVVATNAYGASTISSEGNGAVILTTPDAPLNFAEVVSSKTSSSITVEWSEGSANGGTPVLDYQVSYLEQEQVDEVLVTGVTSTELTISSLTTGQEYTIKVAARNAFGLSSYTTALIILCAHKPAQPDAPITRREASNVIIEWSEPDRNGADITEYSILVGKADLAF